MQGFPGPTEPPPQFRQGLLAFGTEGPEMGTSSCVKPGEIVPFAEFSESRHNWSSDVRRSSRIWHI